MTGHLATVYLVYPIGFFMGAGLLSIGIAYESPHRTRILLLATGFFVTSLLLCYLASSLGLTLTVTAITGFGLTFLSFMLAMLEMTDPVPLILIPTDGIPYHTETPPLAGFCFS